MKQICIDLLNGTLEWDGKPPTQAMNIKNELPIPVLLSDLPNKDNPNPVISGSLRNDGKLTLQPGDSFVLDPDASPGYYALNALSTGGLINVVDFAAGSPDTFYVDHSELNTPNDIGPIPVPSSAQVQPSVTPVMPVNSTIIVPPDSPRVVVGCGTTDSAEGKTNTVLREQYWDRQGDSICLAGHETRTLSYTTTHGKQQTSSDTEVVSKNVNTSVSGGWGPVSASLSASLSASSTSFQQITVTEQTTTYVSHTVINPHEEPVAYFRWQLIDVITIFGPDGESLASVIMGESPNIVMGPYWIATTPHPPIPPKGDGLLEYR